MFEIEDVTPPLPENDQEETTSLKLAPPPKPGPSARQGVPVEPRRILWQARGRWRWVVASTVVGALLGSLYALEYAPREFAVTSILTWDANALHADGQDPMRQLHTLVDQVKTPAVLMEVRSRLAIPSSLEGIAGQIDVVADERSNLITLTSTGSSAKAAYDLGANVLEVFQKQRLVSEHRLREELSASLAARLDAAKKSLDDLRDQQQAFLKAEQVTDLKAELSQSTSDNLRYAQEQRVANADAEVEDARVKSLKYAIEHRTTTAVISERSVRPDGAKQAELESELSGLLAGGLSEDHPRIKLLRSQIRGIREHQINGWEHSVVTERNIGRNPELDLFHNRLIDAEAARDAAISRSKSLGELAAASAAQIERLREVERRGGDLARSVTAAENHVADLDAQHFQSVEAAHSPLTGISLLEAPAMPSAPRHSQRRLYAMAGVLLGALIGVLIVIAWCLRGLRVHTTTELAFWGNGPVLTSSQWPRRAVQPDLQEELHSQFRDGAQAGVLLVPMGSRELTLLKELAHVAHWPGDEQGRAEDAPVRAWLDKPAGHALRKAVRGASRVVVLVSAGEHSVLEISEFAMRIGARESVGYVLVDVTDELVVLPESVGDVPAFWHPAGEGPRLRVVSSNGR